LSDVEIGTKLDMRLDAISNIRTRFQQIGLDCLEDAPCSGKPPAHCPQTKKKIVTTACGKTPE